MPVLSYLHQLIHAEACNINMRASRPSCYYRLPESHPLLAEPAREILSNAWTTGSSALNRGEAHL
jgi:hypothetical protein